uniref:Uncharacterized protein n=1 Tax=Chrysotila carterae TaxID=13221 RepID=A0A7S4EWF0_CHRCT
MQAGAQTRARARTCMIGMRTRSCTVHKQTRSHTRVRKREHTRPPRAVRQMRAHAHERTPTKKPAACLIFTRAHEHKLDTDNPYTHPAGMRQDSARSACMGSRDACMGSSLWSSRCAHTGTLTGLNSTSEQKPPPSVASSCTCGWCIVYGSRTQIELARRSGGKHISSFRALGSEVEVSRQLFSMASSELAMMGTSSTCMILCKKAAFLKPEAICCIRCGFRPKRSTIPELNARVVQHVWLPIWLLSSTAAKQSRRSS